MSRLPDRWLKYSPFGTPVPGTRFLPFKTPLKEAICRRKLQDSNDWFTPEILLENVPQVKLVIDLTFTNRYYSKMEFLNHGVNHVKIKCPGGGQIPPPSMVRMFNNAVNTFLRSEDGRNEESLIGVHCTHGLNRTGYFICYYMVSFCDFYPNVAFEVFESARGYKIERMMYKNSIVNDTMNPQRYYSPRKYIKNNRRKRFNRTHHHHQ